MYPRRRRRPAWRGASTTGDADCAMTTAPAAIRAVAEQHARLVAVALDDEARGARSRRRCRARASRTRGPPPRGSAPGRARRAAAPRAAPSAPPPSGSKAGRRTSPGPATRIALENWRRRPDLNRGWRFCRPLPYHLATAPAGRRSTGVTARWTAVAMRKRTAREEWSGETGFEPATSTLARSHSTTELFPLVATAAKLSYHRAGAASRRTRGERVPHHLEDRRPAATGGDPDDVEAARRRRPARGRSGSCAPCSRAAAAWPR